MDASEARQRTGESGLRPAPRESPELRRAISRLGGRERRILELRHGLAGERRHSFAEIGRLLGLSRQRIRQIESKALQRLGFEGDVPPRSSAQRDEDALLLKGLLRPWTLLLLWLEPAHGYALIERLSDVGVRPDTGGLYRLLAQLEEEGCVRSSWASADGTGPSRRVCTLTRKGTQELRRDAEALEDVGAVLRRFSSYYREQALRLDRERQRARPDRRPGSMLRS